MTAMDVCQSAVNKKKAWLHMEAMFNVHLCKFAQMNTAYPPNNIPTPTQNNIVFFFFFFKEDNFHKYLNFKWWRA